MSQTLQERLSALRSQVDDAWRVLDLDAVKHEIHALEVEAGAPDFWNDQDRARRESQKLADLRSDYDAWVQLRSDVMELEELCSIEEGDLDDEVTTHLEGLEHRYREMEFAMLFCGSHDAKSAVVSIHAGAGGTDAQDWAEMLLRMYLRYAERKQWKVKVVDESRGTEAGIKSAMFFVEGRHAYGHLRGEAGVHRLVRLSPFNADHLRQTSFALVEVLPEFDENVAVDVNPEDLRIDTFMSSGKGGQSVNTTYSAVRIVHEPTGIMVSCQNERSQQQNKEMAMRILKSKLLKIKEAERSEEKKELRGEYHSAEWGNQIRNYVLHPYQMVKDVRTGVETTETEKVLDGDLDRFVEGYLRLQAGQSDKRAELNRD
ncbi:peptide chain release factor 2 [Candidatus Uhrbacteria bacterium]|nr:peptide chain release factor 2 [Candidatus Uhrbacteria bacterium]MBD3284036.1 peptide chain release factor 2 [Candidatus Uhrbacteria bacterium]